ncbi:MAG TPA: cytochrome c biogenesis protein CcsA [Saprospiraceae bacterium]|nr:cytochrome c biogenesis protein CcsA [Saprospiraceae bacterium]HMP12445.1 cytochrome c biogenesis protein CcsA [Saprospiraceae bacterium]
MIQRNWWKALSVIILLYVIIAGMLFPLKPGISMVEPRSARTGDLVTLRVEGYNSNFKQADGAIRAWLKLDDEYFLGAQHIRVHNDQQLNVVFQLPEALPSAQKVQEMTLILDNPVDGSSLLPNALFVTQQSVNPALGTQTWPHAPLDNLHTRRGIAFPFRNILSETIRNTYFHVALWLAMVLLFINALIQSIRYLRTYDANYDRRAVAFTSVGVFYGILGVVTGAIWAKHTWGAYWSWDVKQNMTAISLLIYFAYFVLRNAFEDQEKKARLAAVYNIFAFVALIPLIYVIPRMTDSLHPGAGGNPAFGSQDLDNTMRLIFYPAVIGWALLGIWIAQISYRLKRVQAILFEYSDTSDN